MAKQSRKQEVGLTRKQVSLSRRDQQARTRLLIGIVVVSVVVLGVIAAGLLTELVFKPSAPIAVVNGTKITTAQYQKLVRYQRNSYSNYLRTLGNEKAGIDANDQKNAFMIQYYDQMITQAQTEYEGLGQSVLEQMIEDKLIRQGAAQEGVAVTEDDVDQQIEKIFGYQRTPPTPTTVPTPAPAQEGTPTPTIEPLPTSTPVTKESYEKSYTQYLENLKQSASFDEADYRDLVKGSLYKSKLQEVLSARVPTTGEQVLARHILVADEATAKTVLERLQKGEDFAALAKEFSTDTSNKDSGGDLGWFSRGAMVKAFEDVAFTLPVGQLSEPVKTDFGYHIIKVEGHETNRELDANALSQAQSAAFTTWLDNAKQTGTIERYWTEDKVPPTATPIYQTQQQNR